MLMDVKLEADCVKKYEASCARGRLWLLNTMRKLAGFGSPLLFGVRRDE
jgi:hypothetical protein